MSTYNTAPDLSRRPPRSPRVRLGGYVHLARLLDKVRAVIAGTPGDYIYPCPLDKRFFAFTGLDAEAFLAAVREHRSDTAMLTWVQANAQPRRLAHEIVAWSTWLENVGPGDAGRHQTFADTITTLAAGRTDIVTAFERLDLDDYVSFGGVG